MYIINTDDCYTNCKLGCDCLNHRAAIDNMYVNIVNALRHAEFSTVPRVPQHCFKPFWNEHLDDLKEKSVFWGRLWMDAGRPRSGELCRIKNVCSLNYKNAIRQAVYVYEHSFDDALYEHFIRKEPAEFWKCWNRKFRRTSASNKPLHINGIQGNEEIANEFSKFFNGNFVDSSADSDARKEFVHLCENIGQFTPVCDSTALQHINVEVIDKCLRGLKLGKASGPDGLNVEHLVHAHPKLIVLFKALFRSIALHCYVPAEFGKGIIIPLIKNKCGDASSPDNYRAITLIPVISKLFERVILDMSESYLQTDDTQFGFKKQIGCTNAIFVVRSTVDYFLQRGSSVYAAALDISKAYDSVQHYKLFSSLLRTGLPSWIVYVLVDWYSKLSVAVRWNDSYSQYFSVCSGVRQGSSISPALFNVFINKLLVELKLLGQGCCVNRAWLGCVIYADDVILLSSSICGLQAMLNRCSDVVADLRLKFNCSKSTCIVFGPSYRKPNLPIMYIGNEPICWSSSVKYLGVTFLSGLHLKCDVDCITRKFYAASNCIFGSSVGLDDILQLNLQTVYSLPVLQYATAAINLSNNELKMLNACWNSVFRKIFKYNRWESVNELIDCLGRVNFSHLWYLSVVKLVKSMLLSSNIVIVRTAQLFCYGREWFSIVNYVGVDGHCSVNMITRTIYDKFKSLIELI